VARRRAGERGKVNHESSRFKLKGRWIEEERVFISGRSWIMKEKRERRGGYTKMN